MKHIHSFFPDFAAKVEECDPNYEGRNAQITKWKRDKVVALLQEPLFANLDTSETTEAWQNVCQQFFYLTFQLLIHLVSNQAIIRVYGNYFNTSIKKGKPTSATKPAGPSTRGLVIFSGKISLKALFALECHQEITALYKSICQERGIPGGPAKSKATTQLWEQEDHAIWEEKAEEFANNIDV